MSITPLRDQRGVAMVLELVLVAAVIGLVGFAIYQGTTKNRTASEQTAKTAQSTESLATSAAKIADEASAADTDLADSAESAASELSDADADVTSLGDTANASF